jgi:hypothetical protein
MMLRNLLQEIVRRRLWPIPVLALLIVVAAPVLFMKSAPAGAPAAQTAAPAPATPGILPARAQRLLAATAAVSSRHGATGAEHDPFEAPASHRAAAATTAGAATPAATDKPKASGSGSGAAAGTSTTPAPDPVVSQNVQDNSTNTPATGSTSGPATVDVRFGKTPGSRVHRAIPRLQTFYIHGKLAAVFVKYSPSLNRAVFAVSPDLIVTGPVKCRMQKGVCRYVDIPAGSYARLTMLTADRILVTRRLDVAGIKHGRTAGSTTAVAAADRPQNACLLGKLLALRPGGTPIDRVACER